MSAVPGLARAGSSWNRTGPAKKLTAAGRQPNRQRTSPCFGVSLTTSGAEHRTPLRPPGFYRRKSPWPPATDPQRNHDGSRLKKQGANLEYRLVVIDTLRYDYVAATAGMTTFRRPISTGWIFVAGSAAQSSSSTVGRTRIRMKESPASNRSSRRRLGSSNAPAFP